MLTQALMAFAGLGFFFAGLNMLSGVVRSFAAKQVRVALARLAKVPFSNAVAGTLLGAVTQSTSAAAYVCIGLLQSRAINFPAALTVSAWSGVGTSLLVFLASIDLRLAALFALALVAILHLAALHRHDAGRRVTELLLAVGVTLIGLAMVKDAGHVLEQNAWAREFFTFSSESWVYGFLIGFAITLVMQSSSTVSILAIAMSAAGLLPLESAVVLVCGANLGSGLSVALLSSHLIGLPRQLAMWQAVVKGLGTSVVLIATLVLFKSGIIERHVAPAFQVPTLIAITYLLLNLVGALLAAAFRTTLCRLLARLAPLDQEKQQFEPAFLMDEAVDDPETAFILARQEQSRLIGLLPDALSLLRPDQADMETQLDNNERRLLSATLIAEIESFVSEAVNRHPQNADFRGLLLLQRSNNHILPLIDALHGYVDELNNLKTTALQERGMCTSMTESLHFLLGLVADQARGEDVERDMLKRLTADRSTVMTRFRNEIAVNSAQSNATREALFVATGLFERMVWLIRQLSTDIDLAGSDLTGAKP
jgi:phosphate:Na+ symporter